MKYPESLMNVAVVDPTNKNKVYIYGYEHNGFRAFITCITASSHIDALNYANDYNEKQRIALKLRKEK